jgi:hypothetical protein
MKLADDGPACLLLPVKVTWRHAAHGVGEMALQNNNLPPTSTAEEEDIMSDPRLHDLEDHEFFRGRREASGSPLTVPPRTGDFPPPGQQIAVISVTILFVPPRPQLQQQAAAAATSRRITHHASHRTYTPHSDFPFMAAAAAATACVEKKGPMGSTELSA